MNRNVRAGLKKALIFCSSVSGGPDLWTGGRGADLKSKALAEQMKEVLGWGGGDRGRSNIILFFLIEIGNYIIDKEWKQKGHNLSACQIYKSKETVIVYQTWLRARYAILMALTQSEW